MATEIPTHEELLQNAIDAFQVHFGSLPNVAGCAPGRVVIIGEHTDYNEGFGLAMALTMVTIFVGKKNGKNSCSILTLCPRADKPHVVNIDLHKKITPGSPKWANYVKGVLALFPGTIPGFDAVIVSSVPFKGGVGSSAALEVSTYTFLEELTGQITENLIQKVLICQKVENEYAATPCGIMDQFISVMGKKNNALLIDCRAMEATLIPFNSNKVKLLITNSDIKHELSSSEYPIRRKQCDIAAKILSKKSLRDAKESDVKVLQDIGADKDIIKRAKHVVGENFRTEQGANALEEGDFKKLGNLMIASHNSLRDNFQVSCKELDRLVQAALDVEGVYGSRMMGSGSGGSTITLVKLNAVNNLIQHMSERCIGQATYYVATFMDGCHSLSSKLKNIKVTGKHLKPVETKPKSEEEELEQKMEQELTHDIGEMVIKSKTKETNLKQKDTLQKSQEPESTLQSTKQGEKPRNSKPTLSDHVVKQRPSKSTLSDHVVKQRPSKSTLSDHVVKPRKSKSILPDDLTKPRMSKHTLTEPTDTSPETKSKDSQPEEEVKPLTMLEEQKPSSKPSPVSNSPKRQRSKSQISRGHSPKSSPPGQDSNPRGSKRIIPVQDAKPKGSKTISPEQKEKSSDSDENL